MKCAMCNNGETTQRAVTEFLERDMKSVIVRNVPAEVCENCGEVYLDADTTRRLLEIAEKAISNGERIIEEVYTAA